MHFQSVASPQIEEIISASKRLVPRIAVSEICPFCATAPAQTQRSFASHVGRHQQDISLAALPNLDDESDDESGDSSSDNDDDENDEGNGGREETDKIQIAAAVAVDQDYKDEDDAKSLSGHKGTYHNFEPKLEVQHSNHPSDVKRDSDQSLRGESETAGTEKADNSSNKQTQQLIQRREIIKELVDSEAVYLKDMNVAVEIYKGTAEACPVLKENDIWTIFRNLDQIVAFSTSLLQVLKVASSSVYSTASRSSISQRSRSHPENGTTKISSQVEDTYPTSKLFTATEESDFSKDQKTHIGEEFTQYMQEMREVYADCLTTSERAILHLGRLESDPSIKVWLGECGLVSKDFTSLPNLQALLLRPTQRIYQYPQLLDRLKDNTSADHPDYQALKHVCQIMGTIIEHIQHVGDAKKRGASISRILGKEKESRLRGGPTHTFIRPELPFIIREGEQYQSLCNQFTDDHARLEVTIRDLESYIRTSNAWVADFLRYLSAIELVMRMSASPYPELESKWARFNISVRGVNKNSLSGHVS